MLSRFNSVARSRHWALAAAANLLLAGCSSGQAITNPPPLAHRTYDCSILERASDAVSRELIYLEPFGDSSVSRMCVLDWNGHLQREIPRALAERQSADGTRLLVVDYPVAGSSGYDTEPFLIVTSDNNVVDRYTTIWNREALWADDNRHLCAIEQGLGSQGVLVEIFPGSVLHVVTVAGPIVPTRTGTPSPSGGPLPIMPGDSPHILACSKLADRAVILDRIYGILRVVRLSDGSVLATHHYHRRFTAPTDPKHFLGLISSRDGRYVAEQLSADGTTAQPVMIRDIASDKVLATLHSIQLTAFSWDGTRAVVERGGNSAIIDWRSGRIIRQLAGFPSSAFARPNSNDFVVCVPSTQQAFGCDLYVVRGSGEALEIARSVNVPFGM